MCHSGGRHERRRSCPVASIQRRTEEVVLTALEHHGLLDPARREEAADLIDEVERRFPAPVRRAPCAGSWPRWPATSVRPSSLPRSRCSSPHAGSASWRSACASACCRGRRACSPARGRDPRRHWAAGWAHCGPSSRRGTPAPGQRPVHRCCRSRCRGRDRLPDRPGQRRGGRQGSPTSAWAERPPCWSCSPRSATALAPTLLGQAAMGDGGPRTASSSLWDSVRRHHRRCVSAWATWRRRGLARAMAELAGVARGAALLG